MDHLFGYVGREGGGVVWDSFWSAWDAFAETGSYRETIEYAVRFGNDTDTTAAIAGGLAGIHWGIDGIPTDWLEGMRGREVVEPLVDRLSTAAPDRELRVDEVDLRRCPGLAAAPGRLGMTFLPGKRGVNWLGQAHERDLDADAATLHRLGVDALVLLVEDHELVDWMVPTVVEVLAANEVETVRFPIVDVDVPSDPIAFAALLDTIEGRSGGRRVPGSRLPRRQRPYRHRRRLPARPERPERHVARSN